MTMEMSALLSVVFCLCIGVTSTYIIGDNRRDDSCAYTFQVWRPSDDVIAKIRRLEVTCSNITSTVDHQLLKLQNQLIGEVMNSHNVTHRLERDLLQQKLEHIQQEIDMKDLRLSLADMRTETGKIWKVVVGGGGTRVTSRDSLPPVVVQPYEVLKLGDDVDKTRGVVSQLKNSVGDLKAEWLLIKREVNGMKSENLQMKFHQNDLKADTVKLKSLIEGIKSQTSLIRSERDDVSMAHETMTKVLNDYMQGSGGGVHQNEELSKLRNELIDIRAHADSLESEVVRLATVSDQIRNEALGVLGGQRNISAGDVARILHKMAAISPGNYGNHETAENNIPKDCHDVYRQGHHVSGVYAIKPDAAAQLDNVYCEMVNQTGWTVLMRRQDATISFSKGWLEYQHGFGSLYGEFWLGNEKIHQLSTQKRYRLRVDLWDWEGGRVYAEYDHFAVGSRDTNYKLTARGYTGNAGDSLSDHNDMAFSTADSDNDMHMINCAETNKGGWWYNACYSSNLNGLYHTGWYTKNVQTFSDVIIWYTVKESEFYSLHKAEMKVQPVYLN